MLDRSFYKSQSWLRCRSIVLVRDHYLCQECLRQGILTPANTVHHIKPLKERPDLALVVDNLETICASCHNKEHPERNRRNIKSKTITNVHIEKGNPDIF